MSADPVNNAIQRAKIERTFEVIAEFEQLSNLPQSARPHTASDEHLRAAVVDALGDIANAAGSAAAARDVDDVGQRVHTVELDEHVEQKRITQEKLRKREQSYIYGVRSSIKQFFDHYEQLASTVDALTAESSNVQNTDHASEVSNLSQSLLDDLSDPYSDTTEITSPWEEEGYDSKQEWLDDLPRK